MLEYAGYFAAFLTTVAFVPQAYKSIKTKATADISLAMYCMFCAGIFFWLVYGLQKNDLPIIIANAITLFLSSIILWIKIGNVRAGQEKP